MQVVAKGAGYDVVKAGGANMLQGQNGKIGQELFTGKWKFLVKSVQRTDKYMLRYAVSKFELEAGDNDLVIVDCRFKNGVNEAAYIYFNGLGNTALTDMEEHSFTPHYMDTDVGSAETILPGAAKDFAIVFKIPKSAEIKDLVYTIEPVNLSKWPKTDLRISLKP